MLTSSVPPSEGTEVDPGTSSIGLLEHMHDPNKKRTEQLSNCRNKSSESTTMKVPLCADLHGPMGDVSDEIPYRSSDHDATHGERNIKMKPPPLSTKSSVYTWIIPLSALIPTISMAVWLGCTSKKGQVLISLAGSEIGGHFTQTQAKGIDFVCSALLSPLFFAGLNLLWFACARVCVINESTRSVPLQTLAMASTLSRGTYDPFHYYTLLRGRTWRLAALGGIALCSALGSSALGVSAMPGGIQARLQRIRKLIFSLQNMIAYEVFDEDGPSKNEFSLRLLVDATIESASTPTLSEEPTTAASYGFSESEFAVAAQRVSDVLYGLDFVPAVLDDASGYIGVNTTPSSMANLDNSVNALNNVPGFRLSAECAPGNVNSVMLYPANDKYVSIATNISYHRANATGGLAQEWGWGYAGYSYFSGDDDGTTTSVTSNLAFPAWGCGNTGCGDEFYIIHILSGIHRQALHTDYGDLQPTHQYKNDSDSFGADLQIGPATLWGLRCVQSQQQGRINFTRSPDLQWAVTATSFDDQKTAIPSQLSNWERVKLDNDWAPPQLGVVLFGRDPLEPCLTLADKCLTTRNVSHAVGNYVYASGEITRIIHNIAASNASRAEGHPEYYHNVTGTVNRQYYRITYVPVLLLMALVSIILAALLTTALMISVRNTVSWSWFRQVEVVRLLVDAVGGSLKDQDEHQFARLRGASDEEILSWAQQYQVAYVKVPKNGSHENQGFSHVRPPLVQLVHKANPRVQGRARGVGIDELEEQ